MSEEEGKAGQLEGQGQQKGDPRRAWRRTKGGICAIPIESLTHTHAITDPTGTQPWWRWGWEWSRGWRGRHNLGPVPGSLVIL